MHNAATSNTVQAVPSDGSLKELLSATKGDFVISCDYRRRVRTSKSHTIDFATGRKDPRAEALAVRAFGRGMAMGRLASSSIKSRHNYRFIDRIVTGGREVPGPDGVAERGVVQLPATVAALLSLSDSDKYPRHLSGGGGTCRLLGSPCVDPFRVAAGGAG